MTMKHWTSETDDEGIVWVRIDKADGNANVLSKDVMMELDALIQPLQKSPPRGLVMFSGKQSGFIMGADITEFTSINTPEQAYEVTRVADGVIQGASMVRRLMEDGPDEVGRYVAEVRAALDRP